MGATAWTIDKSHSDVHFTVRHLVITKVRGRFTKWDGTLLLDDQNWSNSSVDISIDAASIDTNEEKRDTHLASPDFLDAGKYPKITFKSTKVEPKGASELNIAGDLTIHGVTKPIVLEVEKLGRATDPWGNAKIAFSGKVSVVRDDFGVNWNQALETGGFVVGKQIEVEIEIQAIAPKA